MAEIDEQPLVVADPQEKALIRKYREFTHQQIQAVTCKKLAPEYPAVAVYLSETAPELKDRRTYFMVGNQIVAILEIGES